VFSVVSMTFVVGVAVATTVPAASLAQVFSVSPYISAESGDPQAFDVGEGLLTPVVRDQYLIAAQRPKPVSVAASNLGAYGGPACSAGADATAEATSFSSPYPDGYRLSDRFGPRGGGFHKGIDMLNPSGTPVHSIADGIVIAASNSGGSGGVYVSIAHRVGGQAVCSMYMHFQDGSLSLAVGQTVKAGQVIGLTGATGNATAYHTHFELYGADGVRFDPLPWLDAHAG